MFFYSNVATQGNNILLRGYENGKRVSNKIPYKPYLFIKSDKPSPYKTLKKEPVSKIDFGSIKDARDWVAQYEDVPEFAYYGMTNWIYPYIYDTYGFNIKHDPSLIRVGNLDIEVRSDSGFPRPDEASQEVTAITVRFKDIPYVWGCKEYDPRELIKLGVKPNDNVKYVKCRDEIDLLKRFLTAWQAFDFDVITGWNVNGFDIPYLINRITFLLSDKDALRMSPWGKILWREIEIFKRKQNFATLVGVTILDYMELYKKFSPGSRESFTLDYISKFEEVEIQKFDYHSLGYKNLHDLYVRNYSLYIHYNVDDTGVVEKLEGKLKLIALVITMAYNSGINYADTLTTVRLWDVTIHGYLMKQGIVIPQAKRSGGAYGGIEGAYVKDPVVGLSKWVVSFDVNSLYPSLIRQCNISPETFVTTVPSVTVDSMLYNGAHPYSKDVPLPNGTPHFNSDFFKKLVDNNAGLCATGCIFDNDLEGFYPYLMSYYYNERTKYKGLLKKAKKQLEALADKTSEEGQQLERDISTYDMFQYSFKIMLNSAYGALSNEHYRWFDPKLSESVTKTGQLTIRWVERALNIYLNKVLGSEDDKFVIYCDTDSAYISLEKIVNKYWIDKTPQEIVGLLDRFCEEKIQPVINKAFDELKEKFNHRASVLEMKRESIAEKGIWTAKKRYILNVWDLEGFRYSEPKLKMQGIEAVKSSTPRAAREYIKEALKVIMNKNEGDFIEFMETKRKEFATLPFEEIAFPRSCNNLVKYTDHASIYQKGCPIHVRGSLVFNHLVKSKGLQNEIKLIEDGDKIKFCHLIVPNPVHENIVSTTGEIPKELDLQRFINYRLQFDKAVVEPIKAIATAIGWAVEKVPTLEDLFFD